MYINGLCHSPELFAHSLSKPCPLALWITHFEPGPVAPRCAITAQVIHRARETWDGRIPLCWRVGVLVG